MSHLECSQGNRTVKTSSRCQDTEVQRREGICHMLVMELRTHSRSPDSGASEVPVHMYTHTQKHLFVLWMAMLCVHYKVKAWRTAT